MILGIVLYITHMLKFIRLIFVLGIITIIILLATSIFNDIKKDPIYSTDIIKLNGYILDTNSTQSDSRNTYEYIYRYSVNKKIYSGSYFSDEKISNLGKGDSLLLEVFIWEPLDHEITGYYESKNNKTYKRLF